jgi:signal transduction histidine kinase
MADSQNENVLFPTLNAEELECLEEHGEVVELPAGGVLFAEGDRATHLFAVLEGEVKVTRRAAGGDLHLVTHRPGSFTGDLNLLTEGIILATAVAVTPCRLVRVPAQSLREIVTACPSFAGIFLNALTARFREADALVQQREKLAALGRMAAGLAHEINNPAAAARRAVQQLAEQLQEWPRAALHLAGLGLTPAQCDFLAAFERDAGARALEPRPDDPLARSDREEDLADWLEAHGVPDAWERAPVLADADLGRDQLDALADGLPAAALPAAVAWLAVSVGTHGLLRTADQGAGRVVELVRAVKEYSYMDQAPQQEVDLRDGLDNTLTMFGHKLKKGRIAVVRDYDSALPKVCAYGSELNQVWTNLIDNALDAMNGVGRLTLRTRREDDQAVVEVADTGAGIPAEAQTRVFDPFFTTKGVGQGTGLGLDVARRIVVRRHHGDIRFVSRPGETVFQVRLPLSESSTCPERAAADRALVKQPAAAPALSPG